MIGTPAPTRQRYLECFDSVRLSRPDLPSRGYQEYPLHNEAAELQVFLEVLLTLAMGRSIVVPQSYALDSWAFLSTAKTVLDAKDLVRSQDRPFRVRLFGQGVRTFRGAVDQMLRRVGNQRAPFASSLLPELRFVEEDELAAMREDHDYFSSWADEQYEGLGPLLKRVDAEFRGVSAVRGQPPTPALSLSQRIQSLSHGPTCGSEDGHERRVTEMRADLADALRRLGADQAEAFGQRSRLRQDAPWPNDPEGRPAREIVGPRTLDLVVELVDTLYNRVLVDSIGGVEASFVTTVGPDEEQQLARATAQRIALPTEAPTEAGESGAPAPPAFELLVAPEAQHANEKTRRQVKTLFDSAATALVGLMELRGAAGTRAGGENAFWQSVRRVDAATSAGDVKARRNALEKHLHLVAGAMTDKTPVSLTEGLAGRLTLSVAGAATSSLVEAHTSLPPGSLMGMGTLAGDFAGDLLEELPEFAGGLARRSRRHRLASALGDLVHVPSGGPT